MEVWTEDEHRVGLKPILRKVWTKIGKRLQIKTKRGYKWLYVYGFVNPETGQTEWWLCNGFNSEIFSLILEKVARALEAVPNKRIILVLDNSRVHKSEKVTIPEGNANSDIPSHPFERDLRIRRIVPVVIYYKAKSAKRRIRIAVNSLILAWRHLR